MKVFVWNSYGGSDVYAFDTVEQAQSLAKELELEFDPNDDLDTIQQTITAVVNQSVGQSDCDDFDHGSGFTNLKGY